MERNLYTYQLNGKTVKAINKDHALYLLSLILEPVDLKHGTLELLEWACTISQAEYNEALQATELSQYYTMGE